MAPANHAAMLVVVAAVVVCAFAAAAPAAAYYSGGAPPAQESCPTQIGYFTNCLAHPEIREQCCDVVENKRCLCQLEREVSVPCSLHRRHERKCKGPTPPTVKREELKHLPCFKTLKC